MHKAYKRQCMTGPIITNNKYYTKLSWCWPHGAWVLLTLSIFAVPYVTMCMSLFIVSVFLWLHLYKCSCHQMLLFTFFLPCMWTKHRQCVLFVCPSQVFHIQIWRNVLKRNYRASTGQTQEIEWNYIVATVSVSTVIYVFMFIWARLSALLQCAVTIQSDGSKKLHPTTLGVERFHANAFSLAKSGEGKRRIAQWLSCIISPSEEATIVGSDSKKKSKSGKISASCTGLQGLAWVSVCLSASLTASHTFWPCFSLSLSLSPRSLSHSTVIWPATCLLGSKSSGKAKQV